FEHLDRHLEVQSLLHRNARGGGEACLCRPNLLFEHLFVERHHEHVIYIEELSRVLEDAYQVREVSFLMSLEEILAQPKRAEDKVHMLLIEVVERKKRVVTGRLGRRCWINYAKVLQTSCGFDV